MLKRLWCAILSLFGVACQQPEQWNPQDAKALTFAYYGSRLNQLEETRDHVSLHFVPWWSPDQLAEIKAAKDVGLRVVWYPKEDSPISVQISALKDAGLLSQIAILYPQDEPNIQPKPVDIPALRQVMSLYPELANTKVAVIYSGSNEDRPGIEHYDWAGVDNYGQGEGVLKRDVEVLRSKLRPDQKLILVPGGCDPYRTRPEAFLERGMADDRVAMIMPFAYFSPETPTPEFSLGIRDNGLLPFYRAVGLKIKNGQ